MGRDLEKSSVIFETKIPGSHSLQRFYGYTQARQIFLCYYIGVVGNRQR